MQQPAEVRVVLQKDKLQSWQIKMICQHPVVIEFYEKKEDEQTIEFTSQKHLAVLHNYRTLKNIWMKILGREPIKMFEQGELKEFSVRPL